MDRYHRITDRLDLRPITLADADRLAVLHADARVMNLLQHGVLNRAESDAMVANYEAEWPAFGFGNWTATERATGQLVGLGGLRVHTGDYGVAIRLAFTPEAQGKGYGPELARASLAFAFEVAKLNRVVALTRSDNGPSQRSLEKAGMVREREIRMASGRVILLYAAAKPN
ncbi:MAG: GNAT family N-acetyltransferase [Reyranella sp.]|nr:GNAT family N-acetyltransferase [Reyranella sp.]